MHLSSIHRTLSQRQEGGPRGRLRHGEAMKHNQTFFLLTGVGRKMIAIHPNATTR